MAAALDGQLEIVDRLLGAGAKVDEKQKVNVGGNRYGHRRRKIWYVHGCLPDTCMLWSGRKYIDAHGCACAQRHMIMHGIKTAVSGLFGCIGTSESHNEA